MNNYLKNIEIRNIDTSLIESSKEFWLLYDTDDEKNMPLIFYRFDDKYYPTISSIEVTDLKLNHNQITCFSSKDIETLSEFIIATRGIKNLSFVDKLLLTRHNKKLTDLFGHSITRYFPILDLPKKGLTLLSQNKLSPDLGLKLLSFSEEDINFFLDIIERLKLNINLQKELFNYLSTNKRKNNSSFKHILCELADNILDITQEHLFSMIRRRVMPEYTECKQKFMQIKNSLNIPRKVNLLETPFFEDKNIKIEIFFKSLEELKNILNDLQTNVEEKQTLWSQIFEII